EGEQVRAFVERPAPGATRVRCWAEKADGTPVLEASASLGPDDGPSLLDERMARLRPPERLVILAVLQVCMHGAWDVMVRMEVHGGRTFGRHYLDVSQRRHRSGRWSVAAE